MRRRESTAQTPVLGDSRPIQKGRLQTTSHYRLLFDDRAVQPPDVAPTAVQVIAPLAERTLGGQRFVHLDAPARGVAGPQVAVLVSRAAFENLGLHAADDAAFLYAEVVAGQVQVKVAGVADGRHVARSLPGRLHAELFAQDGDLAAGRQPAGL